MLTRNSRGADKEYIKMKKDSTKNRLLHLREPMDVTRMFSFRWLRTAKSPGETELQLETGNLVCIYHCDK